MEKLLHFVETTAFTKQIDKFASLDVLTELQNDLLHDPGRGALISGTGGARKARIGDRQRNRGKSGAFRYMYVYFEHADTIYLLFFFAKNERVNLSKAQKNEVCGFIDEARKYLEDK